MEKSNMAAENDLNFKATELRLGLPGTDESENDLIISHAKNNKRALPDLPEESSTNAKRFEAKETVPPSKAQVVGWPPVRSYRKNNMQIKKGETDSSSVMYVKVSMDGAPYLRKIDLKVCNKGGYSELLKALENMFKLSFGEYSEREGYKGSEYAPAYEDKDGDLMLVGDVPFEMFISTCKRLRIMKGAEARGLDCNI